MSATDLVMGAAGTGTKATYVDDVFSTYLYTGTGASQTINNGIDLAGKGGMVWIKSRTNAGQHTVWDTIRGVGNFISPNLTDANTDLITATGTNNYDLNGLNSNGFSVGISAFSTNVSGVNYASWTFREQPKFFDVVTYTGSGASGKVISHSLGSAPGMIILKRTDSAAGWIVWHREFTGSEYLVLQSTGAKANDSPVVNFSNVTSTSFQIDSTWPSTNASGGTYVAYLFAHNAGGFGLSGTDNVISCGSFTGTGAAGNAVSLGYEPQYVLIKNTTNAQGWVIQDVMRGMTVAGSQTAYLQANTSSAEASTTSPISPTATGFTLNTAGGGWNASGDTYIYMAIRRPMKPPTSGTEVFSPVTQNAAANAVVTTNFPVDLSISAERSRTSFPYTLFIDRLRGTSTASSAKLASQSTNAEGNFNSDNGFGFDNNVAIKDNLWNGAYGATDSISYYNFSRRPGFFDVVCYTGTGSARTVAHNLGVAPELMIVKRRSSTSNWKVYSSSFAANKELILELADGVGNDATNFNSTAPTSTVFTVGTSNSTNATTATYVAYLFASVAGVSKVGSYTGTGATQTINCGFTGGARFVMVKATSTTGDWIVVDTARGLVSGNDPTLSLNSTAAEVTTNDWFDPVSSGFELSSASGNLANTNGVSYIYMAIA